jgi:hypothetical protein
MKQNEIIYCDKCNERGTKILGIFFVNINDIKIIKGLFIRYLVLRCDSCGTEKKLKIKLIEHE